MPKRTDLAQQHAHKLDPLVRAFVDSASHLQQVDRILLEVKPSGDLRIWTLISAPPYSFSDREQVYRAELIASEAAPDVLAEFRLVNFKESEAPADELLPEQFETIYERRRAN